MKRARRRTFAIVALAAGGALGSFVACGSNSFSGDDDDQDAQTVSPQGDATFADAIATSDAGPDVTPPPPTWCQTNAPNAFFCADFDEGDLTKAYEKGVLGPYLTVNVVDAGFAPTFATLNDAPDAAPESSPAVLSTAIGVVNAIFPADSTAAVDTTLPNLPLVNGAPTAAFELELDLRVDVEGNPNWIWPSLTLTDMTHGESALYYTSIAQATLFKTGSTTPRGSQGHPPSACGRTSISSSRLAAGRSSRSAAVPNSMPDPAGCRCKLRAQS